ncbi:MAG: RNA methyltransferase PUA domain-containing protein, partial [Bdellovibrionales bacterium]
MSNYKSPRLYVSDPIKDGQEINLLPAHVHYLGGVMRLKEGAEIRIFNGQDGEWLSIFHPINKKNGTLRVFKNIKPQPQNSRRLHLVFAPIK